MAESQHTLHGLKEAETYLTKANKIAMDDGDLAEVQRLTPMIASLTKNIRVEEERLGVLLTVTEAQERFESVKDVLIELVWKHAPEAAPAIASEAPVAIFAGVE